MIPTNLSMGAFRFSLQNLDSNNTEAWKAQAVVDVLRESCKQRVIGTLTAIESAYVARELLPRFSAYLEGEQAKLNDLREQHRLAIANHQAATAERDTSALTLRQLGAGRHTQLERDVIEASKTAERSRAEAGQLQDRIRHQSDLVYRVSATVEGLKLIITPDLVAELPGLVEALKDLDLGGDRNENKI